MPLTEGEDLAQIEQGKNAKALLDKIGANPALRHKFLGLVKELNPNASIPEIDAAAPIMAEVQNAVKAVTELKADIEKERTERNKDADSRKWQSMVENGRKLLREDGYTDEGIEKIEKMMQERGMADYEAAAALWARLNPESGPVATTNFSNKWNFTTPADEKDNDTTEWLADPVAKSAKEVNKWFAENRSNIPTRRRSF